MSEKYNVGDTVEVLMPDGFLSGKIFAIYKNFAWTEETKYEIHGDGFVTIAGERVIR